MQKQNKKERMKCVQCDSWAEQTTSRLEEFEVRAWKCNKCGEEYIDSADAQRALVLNKYKKGVEVKVGVLGQSYIIRIPSDMSQAMHIRKGMSVELTPKDRRHIEIEV